MVSPSVSFSVQDLLAEQLFVVSDALERAASLNREISRRLGGALHAAPTPSPLADPRFRSAPSLPSASPSLLSRIRTVQVPCPCTPEPSPELRTPRTIRRQPVVFRDNGHYPSVDGKAVHDDSVEYVGPSNDLTEPLLGSRAPAPVPSPAPSLGWRSVRAAPASVSPSGGAEKALAIRDQTMETSCDVGDGFPTAEEIEVRVKGALPREQNEEDLYHTEGVWQALVQSEYFINLTLIVISTNTLWLAIDTDFNKASILCEAPVIFQVADNSFCAYFCFELMSRFLAYRCKSVALKDFSFLFDVVLVGLMVWETWVQVAMYLLSDGASVAGGAMRGSSVLRVFRIVRLTRAGRLLNSVPELAILIKGMVQATRSVLAILVLLLIIIYIFAIMFTQLLADTDAVGGTFDTVPESINFLMLQVLCGFDSGFIMKMFSIGWFYYVLILMYMLIGSITLMNMLIGIICEVLANVAQEQQQDGFECDVDDKIGAILDELDVDGSQSINKVEFTQLMENPSLLFTLHELGVDIVTFVEGAHFTYRNCDEFSTTRFLEMAKQFRGNSSATIKDMVEVRKFMLTELTNLECRLLGKPVPKPKPPVTKAAGVDDDKGGARKKKKSGKK